jgi:hypothetical protein
MKLRRDEIQGAFKGAVDELEGEHKGADEKERDEVGAHRHTGDERERGEKELDAEVGLGAPDCPDPREGGPEGGL